MAPSRAERKEQTRTAILEAALRLTVDSSLVAISLRQVAKEVGIVPTAFYRHFDSIESLGVALVDESFIPLRALLRDVWRQAPQLTDLVDGSLSVVAVDVRRHAASYAFIVRERSAGPPRVRAAVRHEIELISQELAADVSGLQGSEALSAKDLELVADLIVSFVVTTVERLTEDPAAEVQILARTRTQILMLLVGALNWRSRD
ncbi:TetR family transcriptional regulator [Nocardioides piscis]|uniref:TetR family transcriptional regulator n=1 Tax=Nocardioides piscis TaxID=2714938 RepID=A0A6G7YKV3_9ACTN|nr:TetR family transcriptional regulator [Nocardioides piscis]QIK77374.1 TetR family transcriptional regulator [Nocardioides piscis]